MAKKGGVDEAKAKALREKLDAIVKGAIGELTAALYEEQLALDANMVKRIPVDFGRLRASHYAAPPVEVSPGRIVGENGVGTDYAIYVHERTELRHTTGEAKFLENALKARTPGFAERMAKRVKRNLQKGRRMLPLSNVPKAPIDIGEQLGPSRKNYVQAQRAAKSAKRKTVKASRTAAKRRRGRF